MNSHRAAACLILLCLTLPVSAASQSAATQAPATTSKPYEPEVGQDGKDVVWVPTSEALVQKMLDLADVRPGDYVIDLGSGDGRTVIAAAKRGARAKGVEFNAEMVALSKKRAAEAGVAGLATFVQQDLFETDLSEASVITMFLLPQINLKLRPKILDLKPGTRIVSNSFTMDEWQADETATISGEDECSSWCTALLWVVPAKVGGTWETPGGKLTLKQEFQMLSGTLGTAPIADGRLRGNQITFTARNDKYTGHVSGNVIEGTVSGAGKPWKATRVAATE